MMPDRVQLRPQRHERSRVLTLGLEPLPVYALVLHLIDGCLTATGLTINPPTSP
jgi:hypothetical protein